MPKYSLPQSNLLCQHHAYQGPYKHSLPVIQKFQEWVLKKHWWLYTGTVLRGQLHTLVYKGDRRWSQTQARRDSKQLSKEWLWCGGIFEDLKTLKRSVKWGVGTYFIEQSIFLCNQKSYIGLVTGTHLEKSLAKKYPQILILVNL